MNIEQPAVNSTDYQISNTRYTVNPIFNDNAQNEDIESKLKRIMLQDTKMKSIGALKQ